MPSLTLCSGQGTNKEVPNHLLIGLSTDMEKFVAMNNLHKMTTSVSDHKENAAGHGLIKTRTRRTQMMLIAAM